MPSDPRSAARFPFLEKRDPSPMLGVAVVDALVDAIVSGAVAPGDLLPPEGTLAEQFGVSRTVIRESVKRIEEKGLVTIARGRGTAVRPTSSWNSLDQVVLRALIKHDDSLGVLDELSVVRAQLESVMAADAATQRSDLQLKELEGHLQRMRDSLHDEDAFRSADAAFHETVMSSSGNRLAESIARNLFERARDSSRFRGVDSRDSFRDTLDEHEAVFAAIAAGSSAAAQESMNRHILDAWQRRRLPTRASSNRGRQA
ncbi:FadR/GntR family transcriptional regulator [Isoptericola croceus]|uniref:FadR/GntR family transcriptional regulator n=1 Tax=Isoptericola croceus TaxID=3031406 RepID=UPI0023F98B0C|nr:FCD domain-containing protein [Isoptericola croceus]